MSEDAKFREIDVKLNDHDIVLGEDSKRISDLQKEIQELKALNKKLIASVVLIFESATFRSTAQQGYAKLRDLANELRSLV
jgi:hypothetical protein